MKKTLSLFLMLTICLSLCSCGDSRNDAMDITQEESEKVQYNDITSQETADTETSESPEFTEHDAISIAQDSVLVRSSIQMDRFHLVRELDYTDSEVTDISQEDGVELYEVTLKGTVVGYIDDYNTELETWCFTVVVTIGNDGKQHSGIDATGFWK